MSKGKKEKLDLPTILNTVLTEIVAQDPMQTFYLPVDTKRFFDYTKKISKPMDLQTMQKKLKKYVGYREFENDLNLIWSNCRIYNQENSDIYKTSLKMEKFSKKCLKEHLLPYKAQFRFDEKGVPIKKRKYNRAKDNINTSFVQDSMSGHSNIMMGPSGGISSRKSSLSIDKKDKKVAKALKIGKIIKKNKKSDIVVLKKTQQNPNSQHLIYDKKQILHAPPKASNYNCIVIGLQQQMQSKENLITEEDKQFLKEKVSQFTQEMLFKCIKTIQEYEPQHISQQSKEHYQVNLSTITKMTFNKIKEQFSL